MLQLVQSTILSYVNHIVCYIPQQKLAKDKKEVIFIKKPI